MEIYESVSLADTENIAKIVAEKCKNGGFLALYGGMGAGKTSFVRGLVKALSPECLDLVHSPTFAIVNEYRGSGMPIFHFDLYRLTDEDDLYSIGYDDYVEADGYAIVEWSENIEYAIPEDAVYITIERVADDENYRRITVRGGIFDEDTCI